MTILEYFLFESEHQTYTKGTKQTILSIELLRFMNINLLEDLEVSKSFQQC